MPTMPLLPAGTRPAGKGRGEPGQGGGSEAAVALFEGLAQQRHLGAAVVGSCSSNGWLTQLATQLPQPTNPSIHPPTHLSLRCLCPVQRCTCPLPPPRRSRRRSRQG